MITIKSLLTLCAIFMIAACGAPASSAQSGGPKPDAAPRPAQSAGAQTGGSQASGTPEKVMVGEVGSASDAGLYIALDKGYFTEQGLDVERQRFQTAADM